MSPNRLPCALVFLLAAPLMAQTPAPSQPDSSAAAPTTEATARLDSATTIADGRKYTAWFYSDLGDSLFAHSSPQVQDKISAAQLPEIHAQLTGQVGTEVEVISERVVARDSLSAYLREAKFELIDEPLVVAFTLGRTGLIYGFFVRPKSQMPAVNPE
jgi:hypothetical protein